MINMRFFARKIFEQKYSTASTTLLFTVTRNYFADHFLRRSGWNYQSRFKNRFVHDCPFSMSLKIFLHKLPLMHESKELTVQDYFSLLKCLHPHYYIYCTRSVMYAFNHRYLIDSLFFGTFIFYYDTLKKKAKKHWNTTIIRLLISKKNRLTIKVFVREKKTSKN